ncbi:hypothetical protein COX23_05445 [Candidatus Gottesmanbacteria bacterium CG23_combo_of_CG06-09_8_20_14_all_37_19]|nr:MAG: hypothetical protein COX23_05445 [Candidatus Gottesmanbacteria bacterium CG23_combo_of_CG06-09_8_20_14_all_37_19]
MHPSNLPRKVVRNIREAVTTSHSPVIPETPTPFSYDMWELVRVMNPELWQNLGPAISFETIAAGLTPTQLAGEGQPNLDNLSNAQTLAEASGSNGNGVRR